MAPASFGKCESISESALTSALAEALALIRVGAMLVGPALRLHVTNREADRILRRQDGLSARLGRLHLHAPTADRALRRHLVDAGSAETAGGAVELRAPRPSGRACLRLRVLSVETAGAGRAALVLVVEPETDCPPVDAATLMRVHGLTKAEAAVARLVPLALSKIEMAQRLSLSANTVKSHLAVVRDKVGARNLTELAMILTRPHAAFAGRELRPIDAPAPADQRSTHGKQLRENGDGTGVGR